MPDKTAVIFGASKIGRGFIAHRLTLSGFRIAFVERNREAVWLLRRKTGYSVRCQIEGGTPLDGIIDDAYREWGVQRIVAPSP